MSPQSALRPRNRPGWAVALAALLLGAPWPAARTAEPWHYTLGEARVSQQAHICRDEEEVHALAGIFRDKGALPGYFALKQLFDCTTRVATFTPLEVVDAVAIATDTTAGYTVQFVRVRLADGELGYLVTTRRVASP